SLVFLSSYRVPRDLPSFPTRRSSDLPRPSPGASRIAIRTKRRARRTASGRSHSSASPQAMAEESVQPVPWVLSVSMRGLLHSIRSEEHTSELQSRRDLVCRLLLEKKK